jgi:hypothetical protein
LSILEHNFAGIPKLFPSEKKTIMILEQKRVQYSYPEFVDLIEKLLAEDKTTGENHSEAYLHYTRMNLRRMNRIYKTMQIMPELEAAVKNLKNDYTWLVLVEAWCGDVGQNLSAIFRLAELNPRIDMRMVLRDENLDLMDQHLTNGGRSIPKLLVVDTTGNVVATWGPRPAPAQKMLMDYKKMAEKPPYSVISEKIQKWYAENKTIVLQHEFLTMINDLERV